MWGARADGLRGALVGRDVGGDAVVEERSAKGGVGVRVEADGGDGAHLGVVGGVAGVEVEGADVAVSAGDVPGGRDGEGDAVAGVVEGTGGWGVRLRARRTCLGGGEERVRVCREWSGLERRGHCAAQRDGGEFSFLPEARREFVAGKTKCGENLILRLCRIDGLIGVNGLFAAHTRVGYSVGDVGEEIHSHISEPDGEDAALHEGIVAVGDGGQRETADAGPAEDCFGYDGACKQAAKLEADDGEDRDQRVAQGVAVDDCVFCEALGAGGADVVLVELFEHGGADHAGEDGGEAEAQRDRGKDEMQEEAGGGAGACAGDRQPAELDGEDRMRMGPRAKLGNERPTRETTPRVRSCQWLRWSADQMPAGMESRDADQERGESEGEGVGVALEDEVSDGVVEAEGLAEVGVEEAVPVVGVLLAERRVEAVGVAERGDVGGGGSFAEHLDDGVAGDEVDKQEDDGDDDPEDREA